MVLLQNPEMDTTRPPSVIRQHFGSDTVMPSISNSRLPWERIMLCPTQNWDGLFVPSLRSSIVAVMFRIRQ